MYRKAGFTKMSSVTTTLDRERRRVIAPAFPVLTWVLLLSVNGVFRDKAPAVQFTQITDK